MGSVCSGGTTGAEPISSVSIIPGPMSARTKPSGKRYVNPDGFTVLIDHSSLKPGTLDNQGILAFTDFDIDPGKCDADKDDDWQAYVERRRYFESQLSLLYVATPKLPIQPLPPNITYVRPFLSSTFKDFNEERNICFANSFPRLEKLCNERNLFFAPLDLRWGVTSEQSGSGQVIKICLEEIDRSRPYFVCSLGFRNGWALMPTDNPNDPAVQLLMKTFEIGISKFDWIKNCYDRSVTELEILHGALNNPSLSPRSFFYFRDISFLENLPKDKRKLYCEIGEAEKRLQQLKTRIVAAGFHLKYFSTPMEMSDRLEEDFRASIESDFPIARLTALDREVKDHQAFAEMRTRVYVGGEHYLAKLDHFLTTQSDEAPRVLCVIGPSGSGKSSLIANWMKSVKAKAKVNQYPGKNSAVDNSPSNANADPSIIHWNVALFLDRYIGSTSYSSHPMTLLRWLLEEIKDRCEDIDQPVPSDKRVADEFPDWLELGSANAPILLVLDGLDQLIEANDAHDLLWLPNDFPKNVRVVLSTVNGSKTHSNLAMRKGIEFMSIEPLTDDHCLSLIRTFLGSYGKNLDNEQEQRVIACKHTHNPLYLITFLQEVRVFGSYENLNKRIDHYMEANSVSEMFLKVIGRLEEDFDNNVPNLVRHTLCLMMVSRRGLNEVELKGALQLALHVSAQEGSFPNMEFSALMLRLDQQLVDQRGLRTFSHNYLKQAVQTKYFQTYSENESHWILASYFRDSPLSDRKIEEGPWHLWMILQNSLHADASETQTAGESSPIDLAEVQAHLTEAITDLEMFDLFKGDHTYDLHKYWLFIESNRGKADYAARSYSAALKEWMNETKPKPVDVAVKSEAIGEFLLMTDRYVGVEVFFDQSLAIRQKQSGDTIEVQILISKKANLAYRQGRYDDAFPLYQKALELAEKLEGEHSVRSSILRTSIAGLLKEQGKYEESQPLYEKSLAEKIALLGPKHPVTAISMSNLAELYLRLHKPEKALPLYQDALQIMEANRGKNHPEVATIVSSMAGCYMQLEKYQDAMKLYERAKKTKEEFLGANHISVAVVLNNLAMTHQKLNDTKTALQLLSRSLKIRQSAHGAESPLLVQTLNNMGAIYASDKKYTKAMEYFDHALRIIEIDKGKQHVDLISTLSSIAQIHKDREEFDEAVNVSTRMLEITEKNYGADDDRVLDALNNIGLIYQTAGTSEKAVPFHLRELKLSDRIHGRVSTRSADCLFNLAVLFFGAQKPEVALALFNRCYIIRKQVLGADHEQTEEVKGWIADLGEDDDWKQLDRMKLEDIPMPLELEEPKPKATAAFSLPPLNAHRNAAGAAAPPSSSLPPIHKPLISIHHHSNGSAPAPPPNPRGSTKLNGPPAPIATKAPVNIAVRHAPPAISVKAPAALPATPAAAPASNTNNPAPPQPPKKKPMIKIS